MDLLLIPPLSTPGVGRQYVEALPEPTKDLCGEQGVVVAVGFQTAYIAYRGVWDEKSKTGSWNYLYNVVR